jgi:hypothetical protein
MLPKAGEIWLGKKPGRKSRTWVNKSLRLINLLTGNDIWGILKNHKNEWPKYKKKEKK